MSDARTAMSRIALTFTMTLVGACAAKVVEPPPVPVAPAPTVAVAPNVERELPSLLVMPLKREAELEAAARALDELILTAIHGIGRYRVLGPADLNALLGVEKLRDAVGCDDVACAAEIGGALGAPFLVAGQLGKLGEQGVLSLRLMNTRDPAVLARASARGGIDANALAQMVTATVGELFGVKLTAPASVVAPPGVSPSPDYAEFTAVTTALSKRMMNNEYTEMLADLDGYEKRTIASPPNLPIDELLAFYRVTACSMLKRTECVRQSAQHYLSRYPQGLYKSSVETYVEQLDDQVLRQQAGGAELATRLNEIAQQAAAGAYSQEMALELTAAAYMGAQQYDQAVPLYLQLVELSSADAERMLGFVQMASMAYEQSGKFADCRRLLEAAQKRYPQQFRLHGLHQTLKRLPK